MAVTLDQPGAGHEAVLVANLPLIEKIVGVIARRHALDDADADEFRSFSHARLVDDDYAVFRKFGGRSSLATYLTVVLSNYYRDYRNADWGRWRASAAAVALGGDAMRLESLVYRDGHGEREAIAMLRAAGSRLGDAELRQMLLRLPVRPARKRVDIAAVADTAAPGGADSDIVRAEAARERTALETLIGRLVESLPAEDQVIVRMHFWDGVSVADIARTLQLPQRPLYRRLEAIRARLRSGLEQHGVGQAQAVVLLNLDPAT